MAEAIVFYPLVGLMLLAGLWVVLTRRPIYSVLSLLVVMFCLAGLFVMLGAYLVAALQILLYAGAVLVLFLFVIMLLNLAPEPRTRRPRLPLSLLGLFVAGTVAFQLSLIVGASGAPSRALPGAPGASVETVGRALFTTYVLPFELTSFLILAAIIGAVTLAKQDPRR
jgi:NADH-quinone oxidoreductase subunit J